MNTDSPSSLCAREIWDLGTRASGPSDYESIIQRFVDSEIERVRKEYRELSQKYLREADETGKSLGARTALSRVAKELSALSVKEEAK